MKIKEYQNYFVSQLIRLYDELECESFFYLLLESKKKIKRIDLALNPELTFSDVEILEWDLCLDSLNKEIPIQYIIGHSSFYGLDFKVNNNVLIPRPETEELVDWIIKDHLENQKVIKILDIGTGSGCIAISVAKNIKNSDVTAIDVSQKAIETAKLNAETNTVEINFILKNILKTDDLEDTYDVIVSNPPYVRELEKHEIKNNVLENEPHLALFVNDNNALLFYKKIATLAQKNLAKNGRLYFEINQYLGQETLKLLTEINFKDLELRKDIYGNDRMIRAKKQ